MKRTPWYNATKRCPTRRGWYECLGDSFIDADENGIAMRFWTGRKWQFYNIEVRRMVHAGVGGPEYENEKWRGLFSPAKGIKS